MSELRFPLNKDTTRKIIHLDMDAFYASVEERDRPELRGQPLVIARHPKETGGKGVVTTANYEARKYGIHSAMSAQKAYELCPSANFIQGDLTYYKEISAQIHDIFHRYTDMVEPLAFDEAYLDVTTNKYEIKSAIKVARLIQLDIWQELHLTCSAGVSYNKFIAKLASDYEKPRGLTVILPDQAEIFLKSLPIEKFHGVGKKTVPRMHELAIFTGEDLFKWSEMALIQEFGKMGYELFRKVRGIHDAPVNPNRERKSIGRENTYTKPLISENQVTLQLRELSSKVAETLKKTQKHGQTVVLKVRYDDYETVTRRRTLTEYLASAEAIYFQALLIWEEFFEMERGIRLLGVTVTNLAPQTYEPISLDLRYK
ncbi:DNA polymerase IV [Vagococcus intermedius]|uniref:DNA polymerase IV n=1 Tax=Vagococcus intermedius TaxID=2991418 RepID=A0AAF0I7B9_9ENTE|nr:DNA polymerase IV [Vagococcus intermedius]WEG73229.1 DNA polymerase IV [Vagococcus intermedius]WEG75314.1 DNA polymerase IV [Vagococcus intermedius]